MTVPRGEAAVVVARRRGVETMTGRARRRHRRAVAAPSVAVVLLAATDLLEVEAVEAVQAPALAERAPLRNRRAPAGADAAAVAPTFSAGWTFRPTR